MRLPDGCMRLFFQRFCFPNGCLRLPLNLVNSCLRLPRKNRRGVGDSPCEFRLLGFRNRQRIRKLGHGSLVGLDLVQEPTNCPALAKVGHGPCRRSESHDAEGHRAQNNGGRRATSCQGSGEAQQAAPRGIGPDRGIGRVIVQGGGGGRDVDGTRAWPRRNHVEGRRGGG